MMRGITCFAIAARTASLNLAAESNYPPLIPDCHLDYVHKKDQVWKV